MNPLFNPTEIIPAFDEFLESRGLTFTATAIGGAALSILGIISRGTRDLDLLDASIPHDISTAAKQFAAKHSISEDWLNNGPSSLARDLPSDWRLRTEKLYSGRALNLWTLDRIDLIRAKFWAMCDRMRDLPDLIEMKPTAGEIDIVVDWVKPLDSNPNWPAHVETSALLLKKRLGYE